MKVFLAGVSEAICKGKTERYVTFMSERGLKVRELQPFLKARQGPIWRQIMTLSEFRTEFFLDSGAYSAWSQGASIDPDAYATFALDHADEFTVVANLDVIPGAWGRKPKPLEIEASAEEGWKNFYQLQDRFKAWEDSVGRKAPGLIHTYHQDEDPTWLERLLKEGGAYIAVSPYNDRTTEQKMDWLDSIMPLLVDDKGWPTVRFHAFGVTSLDIMRRYPFYSVDSTTWVRASRFGMVYIPHNGDTYQVAFSDRSPLVEQEGKHFSTFCKQDQAVIRGYLERIDFTPEQLAEDYVLRDQANILFFLDLERHWQPQPFERPRPRPRFKF